MSKIIITPLGTISPYTNGNMNCPGFLVEYNSKKNIIRLRKWYNKIIKFS